MGRRRQERRKNEKSCFLLMCLLLASDSDDKLVAYTRQLLRATASLGAIENTVYLLGVASVGHLTLAWSALRRPAPHRLTRDGAERSWASERTDKAKEWSRIRGTRSFSRGNRTHSINTTHFHPKDKARGDAEVASLSFFLRRVFRQGKRRKCRLLLFEHAGVDAALRWHSG